MAIDESLNLVSDAAGRIEIARGHGCTYCSLLYPRIMTTLQILRTDTAASRKAARRLAATITPSSELEEQLVALLTELADGGSFLVVKEEGEVTPAEAASILGVTRQYVDRLLEDGVLSCRRLPSSSHRRILVADVVALKRKQERMRAGREKIAGLLGED